FLFVSYDLSSFSYLPKKAARSPIVFVFFFFNDTATTEIYTLSLHDALPIYGGGARSFVSPRTHPNRVGSVRSEEHTSELQSHSDLVCRLLLEKKTIHT